MFSGTRSSHDIVELDGVQSLVCFRIRKRSSAAGPTILMHVPDKKMRKPKWFFCQNSIARRCPQWQEKIRIIVAYAPHLSYPEQDSVNLFFFPPHLFPAESLRLDDCPVKKFPYGRLQMCMKGWAKSKPQLLSRGLGTAGRGWGRRRLTEAG